MSQEPKARQLPPPHQDGGMPLMAALKLRHSTREYSNRPLAAQTLSDLLWAAFGINRPSGDRTAPYWRHVMVIDVSATMADGVWLYDPKAHALLPYLKDDIRAATGMQDFVATARTRLGNRSFRATGITAYLKNGGTLERAAAMANHASTRTTQLYDRRRDEVSLDEVERIVI